MREWLLGEAMAYRCARSHSDRRLTKNFKKKAKQTLCVSLSFLFWNFIFFCQKWDLGFVFNNLELDQGEYIYLCQWDDSIEKSAIFVTTDRRDLLQDLLHSSEVTNGHVILLLRSQIKERVTMDFRRQSISRKESKSWTNPSNTFLLDWKRFEANSKTFEIRCWTNVLNL